MNNPQASNGSSRQPSPTSFEVATELLRFVSQNSCEKRAATNLAPASLVTLPASIATSEIVAAAPFSGFMHSMVARAAASASASTVAQLLPIDCSTDGHLHVPRRTPCINRPIDHTYTDYAPISDDNLRRLDFDDSILNDSCLCLEKKRLMEMLREKISKNGGLAQAFPSKLHAVISNPELSDIISWMPHGRAFVVNDPGALVRDVLPNYFNQTKFVSFVRQLNLWGFKRVTRGVTGKTYYHELFLRGRPYMALKLTRYKVKGHGFKPVPNPNAEPNFHCYSQVGGENYVGTPVSKEQIMEDANVSEKKCRCKKKIMMSRASAAAKTQDEVTGLGGVLPEETFDEKAQVCNASVSNYLTSAISRTSVPPAVASSVQAPPQAQFTAVANLKTQYASQANASMQLGDLPQIATSFAKPNSMDDFLRQRLAQLQREQLEIEVLRRARMLGGIPASHNTGLDSLLPGIGNSGLSQNISNQFAQVVSGLSYILIPQSNQALPGNPRQMAVTEAIREANQLQEMAIASHVTEQRFSP